MLWLNRNLASIIGAVKSDEVKDTIKLEPMIGISGSKRSAAASSAYAVLCRKRID